jgi:hypothetical protein
MTHLGIFVVSKVKSKVFERDVVVSILALEVILAVLSIVVF